MKTLLETARSGDLANLIERLEHASRQTHETCTGGVPLSESQRLIDEALTYAKLGDLDEATYRLRLRTEPKFTSAIACEHQYQLAMAEKRSAP